MWIVEISIQYKLLSFWSLVVWVHECKPIALNLNIGFCDVDLKVQIGYHAGIGDSFLILGRTKHCQGFLRVCRHRDGFLSWRFLFQERKAGCRLLQKNNQFAGSCYYSVRPDRYFSTITRGFTSSDRGLWIEIMVYKGNDIPDFVGFSWEMKQNFVHEFKDFSTHSLFITENFSYEKDFWSVRLKLYNLE